MAALIKFQGNIVNDPYYLAAHDDKKSFLSFNIAQTSPLFKEGKFDRNEDGTVKHTDPSWCKVIAIGENAEKIKDSIKKGDRIEVKGKLGAPEAYLTKEGTPAARTVIIANKVELVSFEKKTEAEALEEVKSYGEYDGSLVDDGVSGDPWDEQLPLEEGDPFGSADSIFEANSNELDNEAPAQNTKRNNKDISQTV